MKKLKWIIAREVLILITLAAALHQKRKYKIPDKKRNLHQFKSAVFIRAV